MSFFFVSYKHDDLKFVEELEQRLADVGILAWTDKQIRAGEEWKQTIDLALKGAIGVIVVVTPDSLASQYVTYEWSFAKGLDEGKKFVIPVLLKRPDPNNPAHSQIHPKLEEIQHIDFTDSSNPKWSDLIECLKAIQNLGQVPDVVKNAERLLNSANQKEQENAIKTLEDSDHPAAIDTLAKAVEHPTRYVCVQAALALARKTQLKDVRVIPSLEKALNKSDNYIQPQIVSLLGAIGTPAAIKLLESVLQTDPNRSIRESIVNQLGAIGTPAAIKVLERVLQTDSNPSLRELAANALGNAKPAIAPSALLAALDSETDKSVRRSIGLALGKIGDKSTIPILIDSLKKTRIEDMYEQWISHREYDRYVDTVYIGYIDPAGIALAQFGDAGTMSVIELLKHNDAQVRHRALYALKEIGGDRVIDELQKAQELESDNWLRNEIDQAILELRNPLVRFHRLP